MESHKEQSGNQIPTMDIIPTLESTFQYVSKKAQYSVAPSATFAVSEPAKACFVHVSDQLPSADIRHVERMFWGCVILGCRKIQNEPRSLVRWADKEQRRKRNVVLTTLAYRAYSLLQPRPSKWLSRERKASNKAL